MKQTKNFRRLMSFLLIVTMLMSVAVVGIAGVSAAEGLALNYSYKYMNAGYAEGRIDLEGSEADYGNYYLYWADDTKALDGYAEIAKVNLNASRKSVNFGNFTAIPADATKIIAIKGATEPAEKTVAAAAAVYNIPEEKQFGYSASDVEYNFQTLSDIHFHKDNYEGYKYAASHFTSALNAAAERDAEFISTCGDQTNYGDLKEWNAYLKTIANSNFTGPVYEVTGNHEDYGETSIPGDTHTMFLNRFMTATGLNAVTDKMQSEIYYEVTAPNGDHHIYLSLELVNKGTHPGISDNFSKAQMDWLEGLLNKYKNDGKKVFIYEHAPFARYGAGDDKETPYYGAAMTIDKDKYPQTYRFKEFLEANKNIVWFNGHTHIDFKYNYNIDNENGTTAYTVHVPSTASTTTVNASNDGLVYEGKADSAQGYFVDVYADATVINGTDLVKNEILPLYTYLVDYTGAEVKANPDYQELGDLYEKVTVTVDVRALTSDPASVKISLYGADDATLTSVTEMTKNEDGTYTAKASTMFRKMKFIINNGNADMNSAEYDVAETTIVLSAIKIKYNNENGWNNVNVYAWNSAGGEVAAWPGIAMTKEADGTFTAILPDYPDMVVFSNADNSEEKTEDMSIEPFIIERINPGQNDSTDPTDPVDYLYGDADMNGVVNIKDATTVQKYAADMLTLDDVAFAQANVTGDKAVNVRDCTAIQKFIAGIITSFAVETQKDVAEVAASGDEDVVTSGDEENTTVPEDENTTKPEETVDVKVDVKAVKSTLESEYYYASYVAYANLKKAYFACKDKDTVTAEESAALSKALADYNTMKTNNPTHIGGTSSNSGGSNSGGNSSGGTVTAEKMTVYFNKPSDWAGAYIYLMDSDRNELKDLNKYPGIEMTHVEGNKYSYEVPAGIGYIKFTDGSAKEGKIPRTENVPAADIAKDRVYSIGTATPNNEKSWAATWDGAPAPAPTPTPGEKVTVYFVNSAKWSTVNAYVWDSNDSKPAEWPGTAMTKTDKQINGFDVYSYEFDGKFTNIIFNDGSNQTDDLTVQAGQYFYYKDLKWYAKAEDISAPAPERTEAVTVYFIKPDEGWDNAYIYLMDSDRNELKDLNKYPGIEMTHVEGNKYSYTVPAGVGYIKFTDGSGIDEIPRTDNVAPEDVVEGRVFKVGSLISGVKWNPAWD